MSGSFGGRRDWRADLLLPVAKLIASGEAPEAVEQAAIRTFVERLAEDYPGVRAAYSTIDEEGALQVVCSREPGAMPRLEGLRADLNGAPDYLACLRSQTPVLCPDVSRDSRLAPLAAAMTAGKTAAVLDVPLKRADRLVGLLCLDSPTPRTWSEEDVDRLREMGEHLSAVLKDAAEQRDRRQLGVELRALLDTLRTAVVMASAARRVTYVNAAFCRVFGFPADAVIGMDCSTLAAHAATLMADPPSFAPRVEELETRAEPAFDEVIVLADGRVLERDYAPILLGSEVAGHVMQFRDVTARKELETRVLVAEHLAALGTLAGGIGQGVYNPLASLRVSLAGLQEEVSRLTHDSGADAAQRLQRIARGIEEAQSSADRIQDLARLLVAYSRRQAARSIPLDVRDLVRGALDLAGPEIRGRARLIEDLSSVPPVSGDVGLLGQVVFTLLLNAAHACDRGRPSDNEVRITTRADRAGRVVIEVSDTGAGIPEALRRRLFDPVFSVRPQADGTALGLLACHGIVAAHGGEIHVESTEGKGSTFRIVLSASAVSPEPEAPEEPAPGPRPRLLVVDDEPQLGSAIRRMLRDLYDVTVASSAAEALAHIERGEVFDLILSDIVMPGMSGVELHRTLAARDSAMAQRWLFMTGGALTGDMRGALALHPDCIFKPFDRDTLLSRIEEALARGKAS